MPKIILAEDDPMISEIYEKKFTEAGYEVTVADSGDLVLAMYKKNKPDIILLDLILPKMNGFEVIEQIRKTDQDTKIIVFSNLNQAEDREKASRLGANGFVSKADYTPSNLVNEVERQVNQLKEEKINGERLARAEENGGSVISTGTKGKILMMEDEEIFRDMFGGKLKEDGFEVDFAEDGAIGIKKAMAGNYSLFIVDMVMPNLAGEEIVEKLEREEKTKEIPIVILSASVDETKQRMMEEKGIKAFFVKTQLIPSELSKKVQELLK
jgi:CheY-like chemotaxis protein